MTDIKSLIYKIQALEHRVEELELLMAKREEVKNLSSSHPMEVPRNSISRASFHDQAEHLKNLKDQLLNKPRT